MAKPKVKELSLHRSRKYAWDYGNNIGYNIGIIISGDESDILEIKEMAYKELNTLEAKEQDRCRDEKGAEEEMRRIKETEALTPLKEVKTTEIAPAKSIGSKYHVDPKFYIVLSEFEVKCLTTFQKYDSNGWDLSDKQVKIWKAIESKVKKAKGG